MSQQQASALLVSEGVVLSPLSFAEIGRVFQARGMRVPFRIVRCGGMEIAVAPAKLRAAAIMGAAAVRLVQHWGMIEVGVLTERAEVLTGDNLLASEVRRLLRAFPRTQWLDGADMNWFTFSGGRTALTMALDKVFSVADSVEVGILRRGLAKGLPAIMEAPATTFHRYLIEVAGCTVTGARVQRPRGTGADPATTGPEATLVEILERCGGQAHPATLRRQAARARLSSTALTRLLRFSPLVVRDDGEMISLIGAGPQRRDLRR